MLCLAIETSCDDTSVSVLEYQQLDNFIDICNTTTVISSKISSQVDIHALYGGVVPEIGARYHATNFLTVLRSVVDEVKLKKDLNLNQFWNNIDLIAVTSTPGLLSSLKVGIEEAKALQFFLKKNYKKEVKIEYVNHLHGHIASSFLEVEKMAKSPFPHLHLLVSGGNTQILNIKEWGKIDIVSKTLDDAVGECLDKTGRMLGFTYPGGVTLAKVAGLSIGNSFDLNHAMKNDSYNMSYSGLKTQVRGITQKINNFGFSYEQYLTQEEKNYLIITDLENITDKRLRFIKEGSIAIQTIAMEQLTRKMKMVKKSFEPESIGLSGGVSANLLLRDNLFKLSNKQLFKPQLKYTGDNAAMIGFAGILNILILQLPKKD